MTPRQVARERNRCLSRFETGEAVGAVQCKRAHGHPGAHTAAAPWGSVGWTDKKPQERSQQGPFVVGAMCSIERHYGTAKPGDPAQFRYTRVIVKTTSKRAYFHGGDWFALDDPQREVKPRYLDYRTRVDHALPPAGQPSRPAAEGESK